MPHLAANDISVSMLEQATTMAVIDRFLFVLLNKSLHLPCSTESSRA